MTRVDQRRVRRALQGLEFPADKPTLVAYAEHRRAWPKTLRALRALPAGNYASLTEVEQAVPQRPNPSP